MQNKFHNVDYISHTSKITTILTSWNNKERDKGMAYPFQYTYILPGNWQSLSCKFDSEPRKNFELNQNTRSLFEPWQRQNVARK